ncbi:3-dehydroquinate synthase [Membranicola marinus]|uniref:3-dehydroquinate synthase n=1 Tax=Membranihabitans marinus TaxID=1227546 RepID=A0A953LA30_9BACT|nr:3-dehydroquinate synthase [Membranihabitans marinus]MBY5957221.1 3-dehydroquinate synthase [Membranihabitans marinus]
MKNKTKVANESSVLQARFMVPYQYEIHFTSDLFAIENPLVREYFSQHKKLKGQKPKVLFMIDQGVVDHHPDLSTRIGLYFDTVDGVECINKKYIFPGGEQVKNSRKDQDAMLQAIDEHGIDRHSYVIGIGGGALLDAVGYAAAISHRGVRHIRVPTTVLSQNDSGIGVKNGINYFNKKNYLGSFTPPEAVWNDLDFLSTLSDRDKRSGLSEAVKVALIKDRQFFEWLEEYSKSLNSFDEEALQESIIVCARLHLNHITTSGDPFERGSARPLDFGHWAAHKLEHLTDYEIRHGEAVAVGIVLDTVYSYLMGYIDENSMNRVVSLFDQLGFNEYFDYLRHYESKALLQGLEEFREHLGGKLTVTLIDRIGHGFEVHEIDTEKMKMALKRITQPTFYYEN